MVHSVRRAGAVVALALSLGALVTATSRAADAASVPVVSSYVESIRTALDRGRRFPTGRDVSIQQPSGRTEVTFVLDRSGKVASVKTTQSSNSMPIDEQARQLVHRARYPAFPTDAWAGSPTHAFVVAYNFSKTPTGTVVIGEPVEVTAQ